MMLLLNLFVGSFIYGGFFKGFVTLHFEILIIIT